MKVHTMKFRAMFDPETGSHLELDRPQHPPMSSSRFRSVCGLAAAGLAVGLVLGVTALAGFPGLVVAALAVVVVSAFFAIGV